jgi:hypothetical protein
MNRVVDLPTIEESRLLIDKMFGEVVDVYGGQEKTRKLRKLKRGELAELRVLVGVLTSALTKGWVSIDLRDRQLAELTHMPIGTFNEAKQRLAAKGRWFTLRAGSHEWYNPKGSPIKYPKPSRYNLHWKGLFTEHIHRAVSQSTTPIKDTVRRTPSLGGSGVAVETLDESFSQVEVLAPVSPSTRFTEHTPEHIPPKMLKFAVSLGIQVDGMSRRELSAEIDRVLASQRAAESPASRSSQPSE